MLQKKDRKIPHSVFKPHSDAVVLLHSVQYSNSDLPKVIFAYPKYCMRNDSAPSFLSVENKLLNFEGGINSPKFLQIIRLNQSDMKGGSMTLGFKMTETTHIYNSVVNSLKTAGFRIVGPNSPKWNVLWTGVTRPENLKDMCKY